MSMDIADEKLHRIGSSHNLPLKQSANTQPVLVESWGFQILKSIGWDQQVKKMDGSCQAPYK